MKHLNVINFQENPTLCTQNIIIWNKGVYRNFGMI